MRLTLPTEVLNLVHLIKDAASPAGGLYLVGGAVRDALLGRKSHDLDFVMAEDPTEIARRVARRLGVGFFVLDDSRHTARVMYRNSDGELSPIDFVQFTGETLDADLGNRDFTINAIALSVDDLNTIIDPLGGRSDLESRLLRPCSDHALKDDPVRVLRAIRLSHQLGFFYAPELPEMMQTAAVNLSQSSAERHRDEFFKILSGAKLKESMADCYRFGVFVTLIPQLSDQENIPASEPHVLPLLDHTFQVVENLDKIIRRFSPKADIKSAKADWLLEVLFAEMQSFSDVLWHYFGAEITPGRSIHCLALLSALMHDIGKPSMMKHGQEGRLVFEGHEDVGAEIAWETARRMQLSNAETAWIQTVVRHHMALIPLTRAQNPPDRRSVFRYFQKTGEAGIAIAFLALADKAATYMGHLTVEQWQAQLTVSKILLSAWWEEREAIIYPTPLLNGNELQRDFGLEPGAFIGQLLDELIEEQASGKILTKEDARAFVGGRLPDLRVNDETD